MDFIEAMDQGIINGMPRLHQAWLNPVAEYATHLGDAKVLMVMAAGLATLFVAWGRRREAILLVVAALAGWGLTELVKRSVGRPRPHMNWVLIALPESKSFPSGHALNTMTIYGTAAFLAARRLRRPLAIAVIVAGLGLSLVIGATRVYLGVHYPSDVIAGWCGGLAIALFALLADLRLPSRPLPPNRDG